MIGSSLGFQQFGDGNVWKGRFKCMSVKKHCRIQRPFQSRNACQDFSSWTGTSVRHKLTALRQIRKDIRGDLKIWRSQNMNWHAKTTFKLYKGHFLSLNLRYMSKSMLQSSFQKLRLLGLCDSQDLLCGAGSSYALACDRCPWTALCLGSAFLCPCPYPCPCFCFCWMP